MDLIIDAKHFPLRLVTQTPISDERLRSLRDANKALHIEREPTGELYMKLAEKLSR